MTIRGELDLTARTEHLFSGVRDEFLCAVRDLTTWSRLSCARRAAEAWTGSVGPRQCRKLCGPAVLADEGSRRILRAMAAKGVQIRIASTPIAFETFVLDRRYAILAGAHAPEGREYTVTTGSAVVGSVHALFEAAWANAGDLDTFLAGDQPRLDAGSRRVLRALGSGATDEVAARDLGLSLRTYRRRVAELLSTLGAGSRFQAGIRAGELGLGD
jgi:hypothetical protein